MNKLKDFSETELENELERRRKAKAEKWPKLLDIYVHHRGGEDEDLVEWVDKHGENWSEDTKNSFYYLAHEVKLTFKVEKNGKTTLYAVDNQKIGK